jgi:hypothetical protein
MLTGMKELSLAELKKLAKERGYTLVMQPTDDELEGPLTEDQLTPRERRAVAQSRKNYREGKTVSLKEAFRALGY